MATSPITTPSGVHATGLPIAHLHLADLIERERLRRRIESAVARLIDALDALDTDPELEPSLTAPEIGTSYTPCRTADGRWFAAHATQASWAAGGSDDRETTDEDGGDILDEPHDPEPDEENGDERDWNGDEIDYSHDDREPEGMSISGGQGA